MTETVSREKGWMMVIVNLNKASKEELMEIEGLGHEGAENIIGLRERHGGIHDLDTLRDHGFADFMIDRLRQRTTLSVEA